jgi:hypothetical protein
MHTTFGFGVSLQMKRAISCISPVLGLGANAVSHSPVVKTGALQALFQTHSVIAAILPMRAE